VTFTFRKGPFKRPDAKALQKFATVELPKAIRAGAVARTVMTGVVERIETLSSKAATLKNYPAALNETKFTRNGVKSAFLDTGVIFAGPLIIRVESASSNRGLAHKLLNDFIDVMRIVEVPLPPPGGRSDSRRRRKACERSAGDDHRRPQVSGECGDRDPSRRTALVARRP
jgi:hypothetical protein